MIWLGWYDMLMLSLLAAVLSIGITALAVTAKRLDSSVLDRAAAALGLIGGIFALGASVLVIAGAANGMWPRLFGWLGAAGGAAGIAGSLMMRRNRRAAGVTMLAGGLICFITLAGPALLITGGELAAGRSAPLPVKRALVRMFRIVMSMAFAVLLLVIVYFKPGRALLIAAMVIFAVYIAVFIVDSVISSGHKKAAVRPDGYAQARDNQGAAA